jgi:three-Cys-motif partner protein
MTQPAFGGDWTSDKLERVRKYLCAYTTIFKKNPRASYFTTIYVDAFAGTGQRTDPASVRRQTGKATLLEEEADTDAQEFQKGSARIALEVDPPFDRFLFIERSAKRVKELEKLKSDFPDRADTIDIRRGDANEVLQEWCRQTDWERHRAVVFLDPYGMQVDWVTIEALAKTEAVDLWYLVPLGVAVNRLLTRKKPPRGKEADKLTRFYGNDEWKEMFYPKKKERTLFGEEETERKQANLEQLKGYTLKRLSTVFAQVAPNPLSLANSKDVPIYLLFFAAGNPKGASTAVKIAKDILK